MRVHSSRNAVSNPLVATIIAVLVIGMLGAFYLGQNSVRLITVTQNDTNTTQTLTTVVTTVAVIGGSNDITVTLTSGNMFAGSLTSYPVNASGAAHISISLNNPGTATAINAFTLMGSSLKSSVVANYCSVAGCAPVASTSSVPLSGGTVTPVTLYFSSSTGQITSGQTYNYVINIGNGESISGTFIAQ